MPGFNQSGPTGEGQLTGRQRGMCRRTDRQFSGGMGNGRGRGMGMRGDDYMPGQGRRAGTRGEPLPGVAGGTGNELDELREQYEAAKEQLRLLENKISALEAGK